MCWAANSTVWWTPWQDYESSHKFTPNFLFSFNDPFHVTSLKHLVIVTLFYATLLKQLEVTLFWPTGPTQQNYISNFGVCTLLKVTPTPYILHDNIWHHLASENVFWQTDRKFFCKKTYGLKPAYVGSCCYVSLPNFGSWKFQRCKTSFRRLRVL